MANKFSDPLPTEKLWSSTNFQHFFLFTEGCLINLFYFWQKKIVVDIFATYRIHQLLQNRITYTISSQQPIVYTLCAYYDICEV